MTHIRFWRYALANFLGMLPFNFLIVLLGDRLARSGSHSTLIIMALVGLALLPVLARAIWTWWRKSSGRAAQKADLGSWARP